MKEFVDKLIGRLEEYKKQWIDADYLDGIDEIIEIVNELAEEYSTDTPQKSAGGWIPCSERLPNREEYLKNNGRFIVTDGNRIYVTHFDIYETQKFGVPQLHGFCEDGKVIAWMPIPAPYKENENGKI